MDDDILDALRRFDALRDNGTTGQSDHVQVKTIGNLAPTYSDGEVLNSLSKPVRSALESMGISRLYEHQAEAIQRALKGEDLVLESPTASGKTLSFTVPMVEGLLRDPKGHALMVHPMKALSNDQRRQLQALVEPASAAAGVRLETWIYDGDTEREHRQLLRQYPPAILLTNPEMLHQSFLGWSDQWRNYLTNLRMIVLDEIHEYRGYFGTNIALLFRRFLAKLATLGVHPQIVLASATCRNPEEHAQRLTGRAISAVRSRSPMRPERHFIFVNPDIPNFRFYEIYQLRIARAALACLSKGLSVLVFCPSRKFAEDAARRAKRDAQEFGLDPTSISPYRAGYEAQDRRGIEDGLRDGRYKVVFTTNALEIGIDIGQLDACILAGFPDNVMSAWQRIGRSGRSYDATAYVLFYAMNTAMDQFFVSNVDSFLEKPLDEILIGVDNEELMDRHIRYVLYELGWPLPEGSKEPLGDAFYNRVVEKAQAAKGPVGGPGPVYQHLSIRGASGGTAKIMYRGKEMGSLSDVHLFREAYIGAIYNHMGTTYRVTKRGAGEVEVEDAEPYLKTEPRFYNVIQVSEILKGVRYAEAVALYYGRVTIFENFAGYRLIDERSGDVLDDVPAQDGRRRDVRAFWLTIEDPRADEWRDWRFDVYQGIPVLEQFLRVGTPFIIPCDRHDIATYSETKAPPSVYLYETVPGGIGIAEKMLELWRDVAQQGLRIAEKCLCRDGCARCIHPPLYSVAEAGVLSKRTGAEFTERLLKVCSGLPDARFNPELHLWE